MNKKVQQIYQKIKHQNDVLFVVIHSIFISYYLYIKIN